MASVTKGDRTRQRLLDAAAAEVARHGPAGVSLTGIAAAAGLQKGSVYFHFPSRDALVAAMLEEGVRRSLRILDEALAEVPGDARTRLRTAIGAHLRALDELRDYATVVLTSAAEVDGPDVVEFTRLRRRYLRRWTDLVREAQAEGALPPAADPRMLRDLLIGAMNGVPRRAGWVAATVAALGAILDGPA